MKRIIKYIMLFLIMTFASCNYEIKTEEANPQTASIFPKGEKINSRNFTGTVWLKMMGAKDSNLYARFGNVVFEAKARTNWHLHPGGQLLFITEGIGYYQVKGLPAHLLQKGDYVEIPPNVVHWHGAAPNSEFAHIAISINTDEGATEWLSPVADEDYNSITN